MNFKVIDNHGKFTGRIMVNFASELGAREIYSDFDEDQDIRLEEVSLSIPGEFPTSMVDTFTLHSIGIDLGDPVPNTFEEEWIDAYRAEEEHI